MRRDKKAKRKAEAQERQEAWDSLTLDQKIAVCRQRPGNCKKQLAKLLEEKNAVE